MNISQNPNIIYVKCKDNQLIYLNINNANNVNLPYMDASNNPTLQCIQVDHPIAVNNRGCYPGDPMVGWCKDATANYSEECILDIEDYANSDFNLYPNPAVENFLFMDSKEIIKHIEIYSINGILIKKTSHTNIDVSNLAAGLYLAKITLYSTIITKSL